MEFLCVLALYIALHEECFWGSAVPIFSHLLGVEVMDAVQDLALNVHVLSRKRPNRRSCVLHTVIGLHKKKNTKIIKKRNCIHHWTFQNYDILEYLEDIKQLLIMWACVLSHWEYESLDIDLFPLAACLVFLQLFHNTSDCLASWTSLLGTSAN